jgi:glycosyltransferase involved in cell wall biosynthesis
MRYSIITPTLIRPTLKRLCDSIDTQTNQDWEHVIVVDCPVTSQKKEILLSLGDDPRRKILTCRTRHPKDYGNTARREAFDSARGEYILQIDDDDYYADSGVFETLTRVTETWAIFPVLAYGEICHRDPPGINLTGSAMFMYRRDTGCKFPANRDYSADGQLVEELKLKYKYQSLSDVRPLVVYEQANHGMEEHEILAAQKYAATHRTKYAEDGLTIDWWDTHRRR